MINISKVLFIFLAVSANYVQTKTVDFVKRELNFDNQVSKLVLF